MEAQYESGYIGLNLANLTDGDLRTCVDFKPLWTFMPMITFRQDWTVGDIFSVTLYMGMLIVGA